MDFLGWGYGMVSLSVRYFWLRSDENYQTTKIVGGKRNGA